MINWLASKHWVIESKLPILLFKKGAFAFYPFIFVANKEFWFMRFRWQRHEIEHLKQQLRGFLIGFYIKYAYYHFKYGYKLNPYEIEAREAEK
jgi:hypothetical protein